MEARLFHASLFKRITDAVREVVTDATLECTSEGIGMQAMDSAHISLVSLLMRADGFEHYRCEEPVSVGLNLPSLAKVLRCAGNDDVMTLKVRDGCDVVDITFETQSQTRLAEFELKMMNVEAESMAVPEPDPEATVRMPSTQFQSICKARAYVFARCESSLNPPTVLQDLTTIGDTVTMCASSGGLSLTTKGDIGSATVTVLPKPAGDAPGAAVAIEARHEVTLTFGLRYLNTFARATPLDSHVRLGLSKNNPLMIEYTLPDMGHLRFYLSPRSDAAPPEPEEEV